MSFRVGPMEAAVANEIVMQVVERALVDGQHGSASSVDYQPFGVKVLKLRVQRRSGVAANLGPVWVRPLQFKVPDGDSGDPADWRAYGTADDDADLWVGWGAGHEKGFAVRMIEQAGTKKPGDVDSDDAYTIYLHLIHRPADPLAHLPGDRTLTVLALSDDGLTEYGRLVVTLTAPQNAANPVRAVWDWDLDAGQSTITLQARPHAPAQLPRYVSRWWPTTHLVYDEVDAATAAFLADLRLIWQRTGDGPERGTLSVQHGATTLATFGGELRLPLHDLRLCSVDVMRFSNGRYLALRITFYWLHLGFSVDDLLTFVPAARREAWRPVARQLVDDLQGGLLPWEKWKRREEVPDIERIDLLLDPADPGRKFAGTDTHWQEFWSEADAGQPLAVRIASKRDIPAVLAQNWAVRGSEAPVFDPLANGLCDIVTAGSQCPHRPQGAFVKVSMTIAGLDYAICPSCQTHYRGAQLQKAPGTPWGKHAPSLKNVTIIDEAVSSDVLEG